MEVRERLGQQMKEALKAGEKDRLRALRLLRAELEVAETSGKEFRESDVVKSYATKLRKAAEEYEHLGVGQRAAELRAELSVVEEFLPKQMERPELEALIARLIEENSYGPPDLGKLMRTVMSQHGDALDGRTVKEIAAAKLAERR